MAKAQSLLTKVLNRVNECRSGPHCFNTLWASLRTHAYQGLKLSGFSHFRCPKILSHNCKRAQSSWRGQQTHCSLASRSGRTKKINTIRTLSLRCGDYSGGSLVSFSLLAGQQADGSGPRALGTFPRIGEGFREVDQISRSQGRC